MDDKNYISEGYYSDNNGNKYMSIWTYKRKNDLKGDSSQNYQDAKDISCSDKFWGPFNASNRFKEGYMYNVNCLNNFYNILTSGSLHTKYLTYLKQVNLLSICIVGQDRYPNGANGIAFCKDSFDEFFDHYCCGKEVMFSLGYSEKMIREKYSDPKELFFDLLTKGIGFINISYELLKDTTKIMFQDYQKYNRQFLKKSKNVVVLGSSKTKPLFENQYPGFKISETVIHPSLKAKDFSPEKWGKIWKTEYLKKIE